MRHNSKSVVKIEPLVKISKDPDQLFYDKKTGQIKKLELEGGPTATQKAAS